MMCALDGLTGCLFSSAALWSTTGNRGGADIGQNQSGRRARQRRSRRRPWRRPTAAGPQAEKLGKIKNVALDSQPGTQSAAAPVNSPSTPCPPTPCVRAPAVPVCCAPALRDSVAQEPEDLPANDPRLWWSALGRRAGVSRYRAGRRGRCTFSGLAVTGRKRRLAETWSSPLRPVNGCGLGNGFRL